MARLKSISHIRECSWQHPKRIGFKTVAWRQGETFSLRLHGIQVVFWDALNKQLQISTCGWRSNMTLQRIRHGLAEIGLTLSTHDIKGHWRVMCPNGQAFTIFGNGTTLKMVRGEWMRLGHNPKMWEVKQSNYWRANYH